MGFDEFDLKEIIEDIDIIDELQTRGIDGKQGPKDYVFCCPFHNEKKPSCGIAHSGETKGLFGCMSASCGRKGTFFDLIAFLDGLTLDQVLRKYRISFDPKKVKNLKSYLYKKLQGVDSKPKIKVLDKNILNRFKKPYGEYLEYIYFRKISKESIKKFNILCCDNGMWRKRIVIPIYDEKKRLISLCARSIKKDIDKSLKIRKLKDTDRKKVLFGLEHIKNKKKLYIVEGEIDVIYLQQFEIPAVSLGTIHVSETHLKKIAKYSNEVILNLDGDVDEDVIRKRRRALSRFVKVGILKLPFEKDPNDLSPTEIKKIYLGGITK